MDISPRHCRLYLISPPLIELPEFAEALKNAFSGGAISAQAEGHKNIIGAFQLRLKHAADAEILKAAETLLPICHEHGAALILNDRPDLAAKCGADGVHLGQEDLSNFPSPLMGEGQGEGDKKKNPPLLGLPKDLQERKSKANRPLPQGERRKEKNPIAAIRKIIGADKIIGVSCHDSKHLAMVAGEEGADYVAFGAFYPTRSKSPEKLAMYGTPSPDILEWWQEFMVLPCVGIGGITPANCAPLVKAGADFIAAITAVWEHPDGAGKAVREFNEGIANVHI